MQLDNEKSNVNLPQSPTPVIVQVKDLKIKPTKYRTLDGTPQGLVVHYPVSGRTNSSAKQVLRGLVERNLCCMVMDQDGIIYIPEGWDIFKHAKGHAGESAWLGKTSLSTLLMGMEICNWGTDGKLRKATDLRTIPKQTSNQKPGTYQKYTPTQEQALINFCMWAKSKSPTFSFDWVVGHDEIAPRRKSDPGGSLSMTMPELRELLRNSSLPIPPTKFKNT